MDTTTAAGPFTEAGVTAVSDVVPVTVTLVAATPPIETFVASGTKFDPVSVIVVPPATGPMAGVRVETVGVPKYVKPPYSVADTLSVLTT